MDVAVGTLYGSRDGETYGIEPEQPEESRTDAARRWIRRSVRASALLYGRLAFPAQAPPIELVDGTAIARIARPLDPKQASVDGWLEALFRAMTVADDVALAWLTNVPQAFLQGLARQNGEQVAPHVYSLGALLSSVVQRNGRQAELLERALVEVGDAATTPGTKASEIDEPVILSLAALLAGEDYSRRIHDLADRHDAFYADIEPLRNWISVRGIAVQRLAHSMGVIVLHAGTTLSPDLTGG
jgi:hypothetical protein